MSTPRAAQLGKPGSPDAIARKAIGLLKAKTDPEKAVQAQRYFKETVTCYGLPSDDVRDIAASLFAECRPAWTLGHAVELCEILLPNRYLEAKSVAILVLLRFDKEFGPSLFSLVRKWLALDYLDNWASVDVLCPDALGPLLETHPALRTKIRAWTADSNRWVRRASAVSFIKLARRGKCLNDAYAVARKLFAVDDDLIEKANGWLLREAGKTDMARLEAFLLRFGPKIPRTTVRYAVERFPEEKRLKILAKTKDA
jgi:3-methyladenine DNA glycosylase AlkD